LRPRLGYGAAAVIFAAGGFAHAGQASQRQNHVFSDFVTTALGSVPKNAIVISMGDHLTGAVFYFHEVEHLRPDVIHLDRELLGASWYGKRKKRLHPDLFLPDGGYGKFGWNIKRLLDGNPGRPLVVIDRLETWDQSWKEGHKLATNGLVHPIVPKDQYPSYAEWNARDLNALRGYDVMPALRSPIGTWERALGELVLSAQSGRAHLALLYSHENGNAPAPARKAYDMLVDLIAKAGGYDRMGIVAPAGMPKVQLGASVWKDLGIACEILSKTDASFAPRIALAYEQFVAEAGPDDADLPKARAYVQTHSTR
jgi:hypothetical protein